MSQDSNARMYQGKNVEMFPDSNVRMFLGRFNVRNVKMFPDNSARMSQDRNAKMYQGSSARMFQDSSVGMFPHRSAAMFQDRSAGMFLDSSVNKCHSRSVMLPNLLMEEGSKETKDSINVSHQLITETQKEALNYNFILWKKPEHLTLILMYLFNSGLIYSSRFCSSQKLVGV